MTVRCLKETSPLTIAEGLKKSELHDIIVNKTSERGAKGITVSIEALKYIGAIDKQSSLSNGRLQIAGAIDK